MSTSLAHWLDHNRETLLTRWRGLLALAPHPVKSNGNGSSNGVMVHPQEHDLVLTSLYDGLVHAAKGDHGPLDEFLRLARALRTSSGEDELSQRLNLTFQLRRAAWDLLLSEGELNGDLRALLADLERLIEYAALTLTNYWTASANVVAQQLHQTELLATSLAEATEQADRVALQISNLNEIGGILASSLDPDYLIEMVGTKLLEVLGIARVAVWLPQDEQHLALNKSWGEAETEVAPVACAAEGDLIARTYRSNEILLELLPEADQQGNWYQPGYSVIVAPLTTHREPIGVIVLQDSLEHERLNRSQQSFVSSVASQAAIALENAKLYAEVRSFNAVLEQRIAERTRELRTEHAMLETLNQIALEVSSTLDLDLLLENCLSLLAEIVGVQHGSIMLIEADTGHLVDRAVLGRKRATGFTRFPIGQGVVGWVAQQRKPALIPDVSQDERWISLPKDEGQRKQGGSIVAVPLVVQHEISGVMLLSNDQNDFFNDDHLRLLNASAGEIAMGIHNAMLYDQIQQQLMRQGDMLRSERRATTQSTAILQSLSDGVIVCDTEGAVLTANPAAERILDRSVEELLTWHLPELLSRLLGNRSKEIPVDHLLKHPQGNHGNASNYSASFQIGTRVVRLTLDPVITSTDEVMGAVAVFRDTTREVESDRLKDEFIGTVSHELRTPMTSIKGFTQLLAMGSLGPVNDTQKEFLGTIHTNAERMISIINDLLDITKIEAGSVDLDLRPLHLAEALGNVVMDLQSNIQARQHDLTINIPPGLPLVRADARRFDQILSNLLSNASKYTPVGGTITIEAHEIDDTLVPDKLREGLRSGRYVEIDITDTGVGIPSEEQDLVFKRFYRTENPLKVEAGGTGLGLSLVRPLIELFGGRIWLSSAVGQGSTFSFVVPAV